MMSFSATTEQIRNQAKTVTRRLGWWFLKPGDILWAVEKAQGLKKGETVKRICQIRVVSTRREYLAVITKEDVIREGFPRLTVVEFIDLFCKVNRCDRGVEVNRIEFEYVLDLDDIKARCAAASSGPWWWDYSYELPSSPWDDELDTHWCLTSLESETTGRCIGWELVSQAHTYNNEDKVPYDQTPDFAFIAHARADIPMLVAEIERLRKQIAELQD